MRRCRSPYMATISTPARSARRAGPVLACIVLAALLPPTRSSGAAEAPELPAATLREVCRLTVSEGQLNAEIRMADGRLEGQRIRVLDLPGSSVVDHRPPVLRFENTQDRAGEAGPVSLRLERRPQYVHLQRRTAEGTVTFLQAKTPDNGFGLKPGEVRLNFISPEGKVSPSIVAAGLEELRREYPGEVSTFLGPLLRELKAEDLFAAETLAARQVLATWQTPEELDQAVLRIVQQLDADSFAERETALAQLRNLGQQALVVIHKLDRDRITPQQQMALDVLLRDARGLSREQILRLRQDPDFLVDCLYCREEDIRSAALQRLRGMADAPLSLDPRADPMTQLAQIERIRVRLKPAPTTAPAR